MSRLRSSTRADQSTPEMPQPEKPQESMVTFFSLGAESRQSVNWQPENRQRSKAAPLTRHWVKRQSSNSAPETSLPLQLHLVESLSHKLFHTVSSSPASRARASFQAASIRLTVGNRSPGAGEAACFATW